MASTGHVRHYGRRMKPIVLKVAAWVLLLLPSAGALGQVASCNQGVPGGYGAICIDPWSPVAGASFALNFTSPSCNRFVHQYQIEVSSNVIDVYVAYTGGCFGVPQAPLQFFTTQAGMAAGGYTVNLHKLASSVWPPPSFDPNDYQLHNSVTFTVRGAPQATPVPTGGWWTWAITVLGLLALTVIRFHGGARRRTGGRQ